MDTSNMLWNIPICIFEIYMFYDYFRGNFKYRKEEKHVRFLILLGLFTAMMFVNSFGNSRLNICIVPFLYILVSCLLYRESFKRILYMNVFFIIIMAGIEIGFEVTFSIVSGDAFVELYDVPISRTIIFMFEKLINFVILRMIKNYKSTNSFLMNQKLYRMVYLLPLDSFLIYSGIIYSKMDLGLFSFQKGLLVLGCFLLVPINIVVFYLLEKLSETMEKTKILELEKLKQELEGTHYERINEINEEHKNYLHDVQHCFRAIGEMARLGENERIMDLITGMNVEIEKIRKKRYCLHPIVNAILCEAEERANQNHVQYDVKINPVIDFSFIDDFSLISMIGNLINNALEAAIKCEQERFVSMEAHLSGNKRFLTLCIRNSFAEKPVIKNGEYQTNKADQAKHGIGIKNVKERAEYYGGFLLLETVDDVFVATLEIPTNKING
ncbi:MAG: GHKL domain-containing protein [Lachnospiraceae bacterium]